MKKIAKILTVILTLCLVVTAFSACSKKAKEKNADTTKNTEVSNNSNNDKSEQFPLTDEEMIKKTIIAYTNAMYGIDFEEGFKSVLHDSDLHNNLKFRKDQFKKIVSEGKDPYEEYPGDINSMETSIVHEITIDGDTATANIDILGVGASAKLNEDGTKSEVTHSFDYDNCNIYLEKHDGKWYIVGGE